MKTPVPSKRRQRNAARVRRAESANPSYVGRRRALMLLMSLGALVLVAGAYYQQILRKDFLQARADRKYLSPVEVAAHRGVITDRNGEVLASSTPVDSVWADPRRFTPDRKSLEALGRILGEGADALDKLLMRYHGKSFVFLKRWLTPGDAAQVMAEVEKLGLEGIGLRREYRRYYPAGEVFGHVIGFAGHDDSGLEGLELYYDDHLSGVPGRKWVIRDARRHVLEDVENIESPKEGEDLRLSLDRRLQFLSYRALKAAVVEHKARAGSAVLLDVHSGEVLAMVNQPSYNPNADREDHDGRLRNRAVTDVYEPGSTMKPFTIAAALDVGVIRENTPIDTGAGKIQIGKYKVSDSRPLGTIDPATILRKSSNVGAARVAMRLPRETFWQYLSNFGFGAPAGIGFPSEAGGHLADYRQWAEVDHATLSFGYGISASMLQLAQAYAVIAGDGTRRPVTLLKRDEVPAGESVVSPDTARTVRHMLEAVVSDKGTAPKAAVPGFRVAGKTGTVKKLGRHGYEDKKYMSWFAGMAPASDPRLVLVVMLDEPRRGGFYGGVAAGPVFSEIMTHALRLLNVAPDDPHVMSDLRLAAVGGGR